MLYLLDENVIRELRAGGHANVEAWRKSVKSGAAQGQHHDLFREAAWLGASPSQEPCARDSKAGELDAWAEAYGPRMIPIDKAIAEEWARLAGSKDKDRLDRALVATARVHDLVLVTRNIAEMRGCEVRVLDPFRKMPTIEIV